ncbi:NlpC/P60 family protein [Ornithinimicrobium ciconiae]|uniref:NlpC/P60 family protein n=1 Tax=Ornithinimicrobium ciconiae TaxID=2594265 RepID=A0A516GE77_9MICO|nr:C40 family peptidase [Ornithinimicrobium ciconiae]QDO89832.1 NlpC/P60 family protein [Ornithinimicrobium ciconiae]
MTNRTIGRHRAPSRLTDAGTTITRSAKTTAVVATSGGLLATAIGPASASPQGVVDEVASVVSQASVQGSAPVTAMDLLTLSMPVMAEPTDLPAVAVAAPQDVDIEFGSLGFTGVTPVVEEPEPVVEEAQSTVQEPAAQESAAESAPTTTSTTEERTESSSSRSNEREAAPAPAPEPKPEPAPAPAPPSNGGGVLGVAAAYTGIPYVYGGSTPSGFDCSGYTSFVFRQAVGIELPRSAAGQQSYATPVSNPQPGDLVFFGYPAYHVGIYAGNGMMYDSGRPGIPTQLRAVFSGVSGYGRVL